MRAGLFRQVPSPNDERLQRIQGNVSDAIDVLAAALENLAPPVLTVVVTGNVPPGRLAVAFAGAAGQVLTLPTAKAQGLNVAGVILFMNTSPTGVTLRPAGTDTVAGAASLVVAAGALRLLVSDGATKWLAL